MTEQPMDRRCTATSKQSGERCKRTAIAGGTVCVMHGGKTPAVRAKAEQRLAEQEAGRLVASVWSKDAAPVTDVVAELQRLAGQMRHAVDVLGGMLGGDHEPCPSCGRFDVDLDSAPGVAWLRQQRELRQLLVAMEGLNLEQRAVQVEARRLDLMAVAYAAMVEALGLNEEQRVLGTRVFFGELRAGEGQAAS